MGVSGQRHAPTALPPGKPQYPLYTKLSGHRCRSGPVLKISPPMEFDPLTVQPVASRHSDSAHSNASRPSGLWTIKYSAPAEWCDLLLASDSLLSLPSACCSYLPSIKIREDHRVWYSRALTGSTDPHRVAGGTRVYTDDSVWCMEGGAEGEQYSSRINTCFIFPRFHKSTITLPTCGGGWGVGDITEVYTPQHISPLLNCRPQTMSL